MAVFSNSKMDEICKNRIWEEHLRKETKELTLNEQFIIPDPKKMEGRGITEKPNRLDPLSSTSPEMIQTAVKTLNGFTKDREHRMRPPAQKFDLPITGNMDYGFFHRDLLKDRCPVFHNPHVSCDVVQYAEEYLTMTGLTPYQRKLN